MTLAFMLLVGGFLIANGVTVLLAVLVWSLRDRLVPPDRLTRQERRAWRQLVRQLNK